MTLEFSRIQAICFDVDGTLRDTDDQYVHRLAGWLRLWRFVLPQRDPLAFARRLVMATEDPARFLHALPDRLGFDRPLARLGDLLYRMGPGKNAENFLLIPEVREMLLRLKQRFPLAVVTARGGRSTQAFLDHFALSGCFQVVVSAQTCKRTKPHPEPVLWAATQMRLPPSACLMVGDTVPDIQAGRAAGAQTVGVLCGFGEAEELQRAGADLILPSTADLAAILL